MNTDWSEFKIIESGGICKSSKNNIPYHKFHAYRHTYGTNLDMLGFRVSEIKELMGHSSVETTLKYVHACDERKEESSEKLSSLCM